MLALHEVKCKYMFIIHLVTTKHDQIPKATTPHALLNLFTHLTSKIMTPWQ